MNVEHPVTEGFMDWANGKTGSGTGPGRFGTKKVVSKSARRLKNKDAKAARKKNRRK